MDNSCDFTVSKKSKSTVLSNLVSLKKRAAQVGLELLDRCSSYHRSTEAAQLVKLNQVALGDLSCFKQDKL